jgi:hypothetical protein
LRRAAAERFIDGRRSGGGGGGNAAARCVLEDDDDDDDPRRRTRLSSALKAPLQAGCALKRSRLASARSLSKL